MSMLLLRYRGRGWCANAQLLGGRILGRSFRSGATEAIVAVADAIPNPPASKMHVPVLKREVLDAFREIKSELSTFVDGTVGCGGHCIELLTTFPAIKTYVGIDQDENALQICYENLKKLNKYNILKLSKDETTLKTESNDTSIILIHDNFVNIPNILDRCGIDNVNGVLLDLGVNSIQLDNADRGFSFNKDGALDMRMNNSTTSKNIYETTDLTAYQVINQFSKVELTRILKYYGDIDQRLANEYATAIYNYRSLHDIKTTRNLVDCLIPVFQKNRKVNKNKSKKSIHPATKIFQALRIAVNKELIVIEDALPLICQRLVPQYSRIGVISFHSLEDKIVKNYLKTNQEDMTYVRKKAISATSDEILANVRSRSAKFRIGRKYPDKSLHSI